MAEAIINGIRRVSSVVTPLFTAQFYKSKINPVLQWANAEAKRGSAAPVLLGIGVVVAVNYTIKWNQFFRKLL